MVDDQCEFLEMICREFFQETGIPYRKVYTPLLCTPPDFSDRTGDKPVGDIDRTPGKLRNRARHYVYAIAYAAQGTRPDLTTAVSSLETQIDSWYLVSDKALIRTFRYA